MQFHNNNTQSSRNYTEYYDQNGNIINPLHVKEDRILELGSTNPNTTQLEILASIDKKLDRLIYLLEKSYGGKN